jgi:hypothetical protein
MVSFRSLGWVGGEGLAGTLSILKQRGLNDGSVAPEAGTLPVAYCSLMLIHNAHCPQAPQCHPFCGDLCLKTPSSSFATGKAVMIALPF